ncbi:MAG: TIGR01777 family oxidoreductase [Chthoniobacterales bacterium]|nr:TIGR01777 family oxidoreductase [Chthoniobacterales bacterium]
MRLGITGASGFIGRRAAGMARARGWEVVPFSRAPRDSSTRKFTPGEPADVDGLDAVLHLAGEPVLGLWTKKKRARIMDSRVLGTRSIAEGFARAAHPPRVLISGSAIGYYGDTGNRESDENSPPGTGFLADVCRAWEAEALEVRDARTVLLRTGFVLGRDGGAMKLILPVFSAGLGGRLGSGKQWMSCIHVDDVAGLALWAIENETILGPLNAVMPQPLTNAAFTREVARAVHRPAIVPVPSFFLRLCLGRAACMLLDSSRVRPAVAEKSGYPYAFSGVKAALEAVTR